VLAFFLGSLPWWTQAVAGLQVLANQDPLASMPSLPMRIFAFLGLTLPAFVGFRAPWSPYVTWPAPGPGPGGHHILPDSHPLRHPPRPPRGSSISQC
jgi:hypothetical protein